MCSKTRNIAPNITMSGLQAVIVTNSLTVPYCRVDEFNKKIYNIIIYEKEYAECINEFMPVFGRAAGFGRYCREDDSECVNCRQGGDYYDGRKRCGIDEKRNRV